MNSKSKKPVLYIIIEVKAREIEGRTLLGLEAARRGFRVIIGDYVHILSGIRKGILPKGIYFDKCISQDKSSKLEEVYEKGFSIISQDEEGGLLDDTYDKFLSFRSSEYNMSMTSAIMCWGNYDYKYWVKRYSDRFNDIYMTGSPRVDFWKNVFSDYHSKEISDIINKYGNYILISSNFTLSNGYMTTDELIKQGKENGSINSLHDEENTVKKINDTRKMFLEFVKLIDYLSENRKDINFVIRPHPSERISIWTDEIKQKSNVHVVFKGSITPWIRAAKALIHNGCTTGVEAYAIGVPPIAYVPFESVVNRKVPNALSTVTHNKYDVLKIIDSIYNNNYSFKSELKEELINNRYYNLLNNCAINNICNILHKYKSEDQPNINISYLKKVKNNFKEKLKKKRNVDNKRNRKFPYLYKNELNDIKNRFPDYKYINIRHLYKSLHVIEE
ncbi:surface carbohydrate biosynthesis protein [Fodinicurvata fenggangensis]|uniref:surface carbohydrate biosynthesis protein n=1 Tax=Fodinicurvata fenggangensis TaxID=1121830 RepID=UPI00138E0BBC|nr:surface carbohydrate biosynthesis protein [Fodinicurvata fenggangensis]